MKTIVVYADYVCPYCLLAEASLETAISGRDIAIEWRAFELRPDPVPTLRPEDPYLPDIWTRSVYPLAAQLGVPIRLPSISPQPRTEKAFHLLAMAQDLGLGHAWSLRVLRAFFQEDRDIGDVDVLVSLASDIGMNPALVRDALTGNIYALRHCEALRHAREEMRISSVPTIAIGSRIFRSMPSPALLAEALDAFMQEPVA